jgi:hypothetical protein
MQRPIVRAKQEAARQSLEVRHASEISELPMLIANPRAKQRNRVCFKFNDATQPEISMASKRSTAARSKSAKGKKSSSRRRSATKRELIAPRGDKRYVRRDARGRIKESDDQGRSLSQDRPSKAKTRAKAGLGDRGDR